VWGGYPLPPRGWALLEGSKVLRGSSLHRGRIEEGEGGGDPSFFQVSPLSSPPGKDDDFFFFPLKKRAKKTFLSPERCEKVFL